MGQTIYIDDIKVEGPMVNDTGIRMLADNSLTGNVMVTGVIGKGSYQNTWSGDWHSEAYDDYALLAAKLAADAKTLDVRGAGRWDEDWDVIKAKCPDLKIILSDDDIAFQTIDENKECRVVPASDVTVTLNRLMPADYWNTFCVPFSMTATQVTEAFGSGTRITKMKSVEGNVMYFEDAATIEAGVPCLVKPATTTGSTITVSGVTITDHTAQSVGNGSFKFIGTYSPVDLATDGTNLFLTTDGHLAKPAAATNTMKGMRAYFQVPVNINARIVFDDGTTTGVEELMNSTVGKSTSSYDLLGRKMVCPAEGFLIPRGYKNCSVQKGMIIKNGKKYIVK
jgi:hypothetical protein